LTVVVDPDGFLILPREVPKTRSSDTGDTAYLTEAPDLSCLLRVRSPEVASALEEAFDVVNRRGRDILRALCKQ
jgi:hypothetical protein